MASVFNNILNILFVVSFCHAHADRLFQKHFSLLKKALPCPNVASTHTPSLSVSYSSRVRVLSILVDAIACVAASALPCHHSFEPVNFVLMTACGLPLVL